MSSKNKNKSTWKIVWHESGLYKSIREATYLMEVPHGWVIKHRYFKSQNFASAPIAYVPDHKKALEIDNNNFEWEIINTKKNPNFMSVTSRLKTPEGWVIKEFFTTKSVNSSKGTMNISLAYIEDPHHEWII